MSTRALVTGATGFAGSHLVELLLAEPGVEVHGTTTRTNAAEPALPRHRRAHEHRIDLRDTAGVRALVEGVRPDLVFHLAAQTFVPTSLSDPAGTLLDNVLLQLNLFEALRAAGLAPRVLVAGSNEEYGLIRPDELPIDEETPFRPASPYAVSKIAQDMLALQYFNTYRLPVVRVRPFNHTGPGQDARFVVSSFARQVAEIELGLREPVVLVGNLDARRDFTDVRDVVRAYRLVVERGEPGDVYNVGSGRAVAIRDVLDWLVASCRRPVDVRIDPARLRPADVLEARCDASKLERATGWRPRIPLEQTVLDLLEWWRRRLDPAGKQTG